MIFLYSVHFNSLFDDFFLHSLQNYLGERVTNKSNKFKRWQDRQCYLLGRLLLIRGFTDLNLTYSIDQLKYSEYGRPFIDETIDFNITHSETLVACAISTTGKIGLDIEYVRKVDINDFRSCFLDVEWATICNSDTIQRFFDYWTMKEAAIKADGRGLSIDLSNVQVKNDSMVWIENHPWNIKKIKEIPAEYICHIATTPSDPTIIFKNITTKELKDLCENGD